MLWGHAEGFTVSEGTTSGGSTPPGWYPDPQVAGQQRWWDGMSWTDHTAPLGGTGAATPAGQQSWTPTAGPGAASMGVAGGAAVDTWLWQSIVATILCCQPFGIAGIVFSAQAQSAINVGNIPEAQRKAGQAKTFTLIAAGLGLLIYIPALLFVILGMGAVFTGL